MSEAPVPLDRKQIVDELFVDALAELRRMAAAMRHGSNQLISTSTMVNETWLRLINSSRLTLESRQTFMCVAARAMRHVLIDAARRRNASKRAALLVTFEDALARPVTHSRDVLAIDSAVNALALVSPRQAEIVELRFFGGFELGEIASLLRIAPSTVQRDWRSARAWLEAEIRKGH